MAFVRDDLHGFHRGAAGLRDVGRHRARRGRRSAMEVRKNRASASLSPPVAVVEKISPRLPRGRDERVCHQVLSTIARGPPHPNARLSLRTPRSQWSRSLSPRKNSRRSRRGTSRCVSRRRSSPTATHFFDVLDEGARRVRCRFSRAASGPRTRRARSPRDRILASTRGRARVVAIRDPSGSLARSRATRARSRARRSPRVALEHGSRSSRRVQTRARCEQTNAADRSNDPPASLTPVVSVRPSIPFIAPNSSRRSSSTSPRPGAARAR